MLGMPLISDILSVLKRDKRFASTVERIDTMDGLLREANSWDEFQPDEPKDYQ